MLKIQMYYRVVFFCIKYAEFESFRFQGYNNCQFVNGRADNSSFILSGIVTTIRSMSQWNVAKMSSWIILVLKLDASSVTPYRLNSLQTSHDKIVAIFLGN